MANLSQQIKEKAILIGFQKVGITKPELDSKATQALETWLKNNYHASMMWIEKRKDERGDIFKYYPEVKSIVSLAVNYHSGHTQNDLNADYKISNYAWGDDYHDAIKSKGFELLKYIKELYPSVKGIVCVDTSPVMEKPIAQKAGLGWMGKHTNLITRDLGSWVFLAEILLDISLDADQPFSEDLCGTCTACIDACPTQALEANVLDAGKCISYLSIEHRGEFLKERDNLHGWIYGCDICQEVCPWNIKFSKVTDVQSFQPRKDILNWTNHEWENLDEKGFRNLFKKSAVKRTKYAGLKRNIIQNKKIKGESSWQK